MEAGMPPGWDFVTHLCKDGKVVTAGPCVCGSMTTAPFKPQRQIPLCFRCRRNKKPLQPVPASASISLICVDVCNIPKFVPTLSKQSPLKILRDMRQKVAEFMGALAKQAPGTRVAVFIPTAPTQEGEELERWKANRASQVEKRERNVIPGFKVLIGDLFREHAPTADVFYTERAFCDCVAHYANGVDTQEGQTVAVLSKNHRFRRYIGEKFEIFKDFELQSKGLSLIPDEKSVYTHMDLGIPVSSPQIHTEDPTFARLPVVGVFREGHSSPALAPFGPEYNANLKFAELRRNVYGVLGCESVTESFPRLGADGSVEWTWVEVEGKKDLQLLERMKKPRSLITKLVKPDGVEEHAWKLHVFAVYVTVFRLCKAAHPEVHTASLLSMLFKALGRR